MNKNKHDIGQRLQEIRKTLGLTQEQMGAKVGRGKGSVSKYENGDAEPPYATLEKYAEVSGRDFNWIFTGNADPVSGHRDVIAEETVRWDLTSIHPEVGRLSRREEQVVTMFRYLCEHNKELAQLAYEDMVEAYLDARNTPPKGRDAEGA